MSKHIRDGVGTMRPYLFGDLELPAFVEHVFGATEVARHWMGDKSCHYEGRLGDSVFVIEAGERPPQFKPTIGSTYVYVKDVDATWKRAMEAGAEAIGEPEDKPYQERGAGFKDAFGNTWWISTYTG